MKRKHIIKAIAALAAVVEANKSFTVGSESVSNRANNKIVELIQLLEVS